MKSLKKKIIQNPQHVKDIVKNLMFINLEQV